MFAGHSKYLANGCECNIDCCSWDMLFVALFSILSHCNSCCKPGDESIFGVCSILKPMIYSQRFDILAPLLPVSLPSFGIFCHLSSFVCCISRPKLLTYWEQRKNVSWFEISVEVVRFVIKLVNKSWPISQSQSGFNPNNWDRMSLMEFSLLAICNSAWGYDVGSISLG